MQIYKVYVANRKKDGTITKSEAITIKAEDEKKAISSAISRAKNRYGYKGKVHICSVFIRNEQKKYEKI